MASFDPAERQPFADGNGSETRSAVPRHFHEATVRRYLDAIPQIVEQVDRHARNLQHYARENDSGRARAEMISATRTMRRGQSNQQEFKQVRPQLPQDLLEKYEERLANTNDSLQEAIDTLVEVARNFPSRSPTTSGQTSSESSSTMTMSDERNRHPFPPAPLNATTSSQLSSSRCIASSSGSLQFFCSEDEIVSGDSSMEDDIPISDMAGGRYSNHTTGTLPGASPCSPGQQLMTASLHRPGLRRSAQAQQPRLEDWDALLEDVTELNDLIHVFSNSVQEQRQFVDSISSHIDTAEVAVHEGALSLGMAAKLKASMIPVACGTVGAIIAGPVGLIAGFKLGAVAAAGAAGVGGVLIGRKIKSRKERQITEEMDLLEQR